MKYATNTARRTLTPTAKKMAEMSYVVDRMHFKGHVDQWCQNNCDPDKLPAMEMVHTYMYINLYIVDTLFLFSQVNSEICEETFAWLSRYSKITRHMNRERFIFFILYLCELHNRQFTS